MKPSEYLSEFTREALMAGRDPAQIASDLASAGWTRKEIDRAIQGWIQTPDGPPIPRPLPGVSATDALLYGLMFLSLGMVAWHLVRLGFELTDTLIPDIGESYSNSRSSIRSSIRWSVASLAVFVPVFLWMDRYARRAGEPGRRRGPVRKWFASVTLLIAALSLLGDLVVSIYAFLNGDLTMRFAVKALLVAITGVLVICYYRDELDG